MRLESVSVVSCVNNVITIRVCAHDDNNIIIMALFLSIWCHLIYGLAPACLYQYNFLQRYVGFLPKVEPCQLASCLTASHALHVSA